MSTTLGNVSLSEYRTAFVDARATRLRDAFPEFTLAQCTRQARAEWDRMLSLLGRPAEPEAPRPQLALLEFVDTVNPGWRGEVLILARKGYRYVGAIPDRGMAFVVMQLPEDR